MHARADPHRSNNQNPAKKNRSTEFESISWIRIMECNNHNAHRYLITCKHLHTHKKIIHFKRTQKTHKIDWNCWPISFILKNSFFSRLGSIRVTCASIPQIGGKKRYFRSLYLFSLHIFLTAVDYLSSYRFLKFYSFNLLLVILWLFIMNLIYLMSLWICSISHVFQKIKIFT